LRKKLQFRKNLDLPHENERISGKRKLMKLSQNLEKNLVGENIQNAQNAVSVKIKNENILKRNDERQFL